MIKQFKNKLKGKKIHYKFLKRIALKICVFRWSEMYNTETIESLIEEPAKCAECGETAPKKCSRCQSEWYCRRECQVKHWPKHKKACDMIYEATSKLSKSSISKS
jgi:hypothetical protein